MRPSNVILPLCLASAALVFARQPFEWKDLSGGRIELREDGKPVLVYNYGPQLKEGAPESKRRCCYFFPVYTPAGVSMLDDFPADHWHHRGLFWSWPIVETGGKRYDIWMMFTAKHRTVKPVATKVSGKAATIEAHNVWEAGGKDIVKEDVSMTILPAKGPSREMNLTLTWEAIDAPVTLAGSREPGKSYGGLSARFAPREGTVIRTDGQTLEKDEDRNPRQWAELEAVYGGKKVVLRITPDPGSPGVPMQWCLRKYGFIGASFPGRSETVDHYTLEPGKPLTLKFNVRVTDLP